MTGYAKNRTTRLYLRTSGRGGGGLVNIVGARLAGELPLLELRCQFHTTPASQVQQTGTRQLRAMLSQRLAAPFSTLLQLAGSCDCSAWISRVLGAGRVADRSGALQHY